MTFYLAGLDAIVLFLLIFICSSALTLGGLWLVNRILRPGTWKGLRFTTSFYTIIGALLSLILAMVTVSIWQNYQKEKENVTSEVANLVNFYRDTGLLKKQDCLHLRKETRRMVYELIHDTWPRMQKGEEGVSAIKVFNSMFNYLKNIKPENLEQQFAKEALVTDLRTASELRKNRNLKATQSAIPEEMWFVITVCGVISVSTGFYFRIQPFWVHAFLSLSHSTMISIIIFLIISLMYPFRGDTSIKADPFEKLLIKTFPSIDREYTDQLMDKTQQLSNDSIGIEKRTF